MITSCVLSMLMIIPSIAPAQSRGDLEKTIKKTEDVLDDLDDDFKNGLDKTPLDDTARAKHLADQMEALEDSFDVVRKRFDEDGDYHEMRRLLGDALRIASELDPVIRRYAFKNDVERDWSEVTSNLNTLARYYRLQEVSNEPTAPSLR